MLHAKYFFLTKKKNFFRDYLQKKTLIFLPSNTARLEQWLYITLFDKFVLGHAILTQLIGLGDNNLKIFKKKCCLQENTCFHRSSLVLD